jgi:ubiquinone/menaquinone biosynthesis C-methylase UbiE
MATEENPKPRAMLFDQVAEQYDRYRPAYSEQLIDALIEKTGIDSKSRLLEIGSGTGKATCMLAERCLQVHCIEPGANLIKVAQNHLRNYPGVTFENTTFEQWEILEGAFDLVYSASAFHWVSKESGYLRVARALKSGGYIALFWNNNADPQNDFWMEIDRIYKRCAPELQKYPRTLEEHIQIGEDEIKKSGLFEYRMTGRYPWQQSYSTEQYIGLLNTHSSHLLLSEENRKCLYKGIAEVIERQGGMMVKQYLSVLYLAQKRME